MLTESGARLSDVLSRIAALAAERAQFDAMAADIQARLEDIDARAAAAQIELARVLVESGEEFEAAIAEARKVAAAGGPQPAAE
ncbi:MAG TPA: hypothetical protein VD926_15350 [Acidimicrobiales bacterium]|nr:hypothetical protein [Acidimicrobiales bacterium]